MESSDTAASSLVDTAKASAEAAAQAGGLSGVPLGVIVSAPLAVTQTLSEPCTFGGSVTLTANVADPNALSVGDAVTYVASNCSEVQGVVLNGRIDITFTRVASENDFDVTANVSNLTAVSNGVSYGPYSYAIQFSYVNGQVTYVYSVAGSTIVGQPTVTYSGSTVTIVNGTVRTHYGSGWVEVTFANWQYDADTGMPTSGAITITASNGNQAIITVTGTGYNVTITVNGTTANYVVPFS